MGLTVIARSHTISEQSFLKFKHLSSRAAASPVMQGVHVRVNDIIQLEMSKAFFRDLYFENRIIFGLL